MSVIAAIQSGDSARVAALLAANPALANERTDRGIPAALFALYLQRRDFAQLLLDAGATIDTPLAAALGLIPPLTALLDTEPQLLNTRTPDGWTPLHLAAFFAQPDAARLLIARGADPLARSENPMANLPLHAAAAARQTAIVELLLDAGTPVDATQHGGYTALHSAAQNKDLPTVELLRARGASMDAVSDDGKTPATLLNA